MQKQHGLAVCADLRSAVAEHASPLGLQLVARRDDIIYLVAYMVNPAVGRFFEKFRDRRAFAERLEQLDLGIRKLDENDGNAVLGLSERRDRPCAPRAFL